MATQPYEHTKNHWIGHLNCIYLLINLFERVGGKKRGREEGKEGEEGKERERGRKIDFPFFLKFIPQMLVASWSGSGQFGVRFSILVGGRWVAGSCIFEQCFVASQGVNKQAKPGLKPYLNE